MCCWTTGKSVPKHSSCRVPASRGVVGLWGCGGWWRGAAVACFSKVFSCWRSRVPTQNFAGVLEQQHVSQACKWTPRNKKKKKVHPVFVFLPYFSGKLLLWNTQLFRSALPKSCICCFYGDLQRVWKLHLAKLSLINKYLKIVMTDMAPLNWTPPCKLSPMEQHLYQTDGGALRYHFTLSVDFTLGFCEVYCPEESKSFCLNNECPPMNLRLQTSNLRNGVETERRQRAARIKEGTPHISSSVTRYATWPPASYQTL